MSVTLKLADDDAWVIAVILGGAADIVDQVNQGGKVVDAVPLVDKACKVRSRFGSEYMPYVEASKRLRRLSSAFSTVVKANVRIPT